MTRKELADYYRKQMAEGKAVHGEARELIFEFDNQEEQRKDETQ